MEPEPDPEEVGPLSRLRTPIGRHGSVQPDEAYAAYDEHPLAEHDEWGDLATFREIAGGVSCTEYPPE